MSQPVTPAQSFQVKGIRGYIYRHYAPQPGTHLLGHVREVVIVGPGIVGNVTPSEKEPAVYVETRHLFGKDHIGLKPVGHEKKWLMHDGHFVSSNQPDFEKQFGQGRFIKLFDRYEGK